jgi:hypothetical protein
MFFPVFLLIKPTYKMSAIKNSIIVILAFFMVSCSQQQLKEENAFLKEINEDLRMEARQREADFNDFFDSMASILDNLNMIKVRQNIISEGSRQEDMLGMDFKAQIDSDLEIINELLEDNRNRMAELNRQLGRSNLRLKEFEAMVGNLTKDIEDKNKEIAVLRESMSHLSHSNQMLTKQIDNLEEQNIKKNNIIELQNQALNTAWFIFGTRKELQQMEVIERKGGVLGIGRTFSVNNDLNKGHFTRVNILDVDSVYIQGKNPTVLSVHPQDSYYISADGEGGFQLIIEDPGSFWDTTRYLVVSVD